MDNLILYILIIITLLISHTITIFVPFLLVPPTSPTRHQLIWGIGIPVEGAKPDCTLGLVFKGQYFIPISIDDLKPDTFSFLPEDQKRKLIKRDLNGHVSNSSINYIDDLMGIKVERWNNVEVIDKGVIFSPSEDNENEIEENNSIENKIDDNKPLEPENNGLEYKLSNAVFIDENKFHDAWKSQRNMDNTRWTIYKALEGIADNKGFNGRACVLRAICESAQASFSYHSGIIAELMHVILT